MTSHLASQIRTDVERLCAPGDRSPGTQRNRDATAYVLERMRDIGLATESLPFDVPEWRYGTANLRLGGSEFAAHPGPFSPPAEGSGPLIVIRRAGQLRGTMTPGAVLLLCDEIAADQFTPRGYPFYSNAAHAEILDALEAARPLAVVAATGSSAMTGAMSPFPLIEDASFTVPSAYLTAEEGARIARSEGEVVAVSIDSGTRPSTGEQPVGRLAPAGSAGGRIVVSAHVDSKPDTPGAIDNAAGVAVMLAVAGLLRDARLEHPIEFVPFNGEDHVLAPGEMAWLGVNPELSDVLLAVNIDAPGLRGAPSAYSLYGVDEVVSARVAALAERFSEVEPGPAWPASDHMVFAMRGVPAMALTSTDFAAASRTYSHTPADVPEILDYENLAGTARFIAAVVGAV